MSIFAAKKLLNSAMMMKKYKQQLSIFAVFLHLYKKQCYFEWIEIHPQKLVRPDRKESGQYPHGRNN